MTNELQAATTVADDDVLAAMWSIMNVIETLDAHARLRAGGFHLDIKVTRGDLQ